MMPQSPAQQFGSLFEAVQEARLFSDSKTFADASPRRDPQTIMADWRSVQPVDAQGLREFVRNNFDLPDELAISLPSQRAMLADNIHALWPKLTRDAVAPPSFGSLLHLPHRHVVPGGRFRELYYWDSFFTMLGLARSGQQALIEDMIANFGDLLDRFGFIPNGTRTYYLTRSQPPVFHLMATLSADQTEHGRRRRLRWMCIEHAFWMRGEQSVLPGHQNGRVLRLQDGALLNRYWDDSDRPRDESWREDVDLAAAVPTRLATDVWRDIRAAAESGWDFSSRWFGAAGSLRDIRTTRLAPIDLNSLLYSLEHCIASEAMALDESNLSEMFAQRAQRRGAAINSHLWSEEEGCYADLDIDLGRPTGKRTAAMAFALLCKVAEPQRAHRTAAALESLMRPGGLMTTQNVSGEQWDAPNGWAPLQWVAATGCAYYGLSELAERVARCWVDMVDACYRSTGHFFEKYDVVRQEPGQGGEYAPVAGFGWTNGVTLELLAQLAGGQPFPDISEGNV